MPILQCAKCNKEMYISPQNADKISYCPKCQAEKDKEWEKLWKNDDSVKDDSV